MHCTAILETVQRVIDDGSLRLEVDSCICMDDNLRATIRDTPLDIAIVSEMFVWLAAAFQPLSGRRRLIVQ